MKKSKKLFIPVLVSVVIFLVGVYFLSKANNDGFIKSVLAERDNDDKDNNNDDKDNNNDDNNDNDKGDEERNRENERKREDDEKKEREDRRKITVPNSEENKKESKKEESKKEESKKEESKKEESKKEESKKEESKKEESKKTTRKTEKVKEKKVTIETKDDTAKKVEFYIKKEEGDQDVYLGSADKKEDNNWNLDVNVDERIPNGDYVLNAEIEDEDGQWKSEEVTVQVDLGSSSEVKDSLEDDTEGNEQGKEEKKEKRQNEFAYDWDMDGITDEEEARLGTDLYSADSDQDGFLDSDEVKGGFDPLKFSPGDKSDKIVFEEPKEKGEVSEKYAVKEVKIKETTDKKKISFSGNALPNSFVTLYIYSEKPVIVTVKTDSNGNWVYDLDKNLEDGDHEVYVAVTDNTGKITAKSSPLKFVKTAQAVEMEPAALKNSQSPLKKDGVAMLAYAIAIIVTSVGLALVIISMVVKKKTNGNKELN